MDIESMGPLRPQTFLFGNVHRGCALPRGRWPRRRRWPRRPCRPRGQAPCGRLAGPRPVPASRRPPRAGQGQGARSGPGARSGRSRALHMRRAARTWRGLFRALFPVSPAVPKDAARRERPRSTWQRGRRRSTWSAARPCAPCCPSPRAGLAARGGRLPRCHRPGYRGGRSAGMVLKLLGLKGPCGELRGRQQAARSPEGFLTPRGPLRAFLECR